MRATHLLAFLCIGVVGACHSAPPPPKPSGPQPLASMVVGADGGHLEAPGISLDIPSGALAAATRISIFAADPIPGGTAISKPFRFEPHGLEFAQPVTVRLDVPAGARGIVRWSTLGDPSTFEFAGFADNGNAIAQNTHFSDVETTDDDPDDCADEEPGDEVCDMPDPIPDGRNLCGCDTKDPTPPNPHLCGWDPNTDNEVCPVNPDLPPIADGREHFGGMNGDQCSGYAYVATTVFLCNCVGTPPNATSSTELCARPETLNMMTGAWECHTTIDYGPGSPQPPPTTPVQCVNGSPDRRNCDQSYTAFVGKSATDTGSCTGHVADSTGMDQTVVGNLTQCQATPINYAWTKYNGTTVGCVSFEPDPNFPDTRPDDDVRRGHLAPGDWMALKQLRMMCGLPPTGTAAEEKAAAAQANMLVTKTVDGMAVTTPLTATTAVLIVSDSTGTIQGVFAGLSKNARDFATGMCAMIPMPNDAWRGIGVSRKVVDENGMPVLDKDGNQICRNSGETKGHAEGHALLQLADQRMRMTAPFDPNNGCKPDWASVDSVGMTGGCGDMIVDRGPCARSCKKEGLFNAMNAAGLDTLYVHSPKGCLQFNKGGDPQGQPCSDSTTCSSP